MGDRCRDVARVDRSCGTSHSGRCPRPPACCPAPMGRYPVVLGTFFTHSRLWEIALGMLPTSSGAFPCRSGALPGPTWYASSRAATVGGGTRHVAQVVGRVAGLTRTVARLASARVPCRPGRYPRRLPHSISSADVGRARRAVPETPRTRPRSCGRDRTSTDRSDPRPCRASACP